MARLFAPHFPPYVAYVFIGIAAVLFALPALARRFPHIDWLQLFRFQRPYDPNRDRHLDTAWMDATHRGQGKQDAPREPLAGLREHFRAFVAEFPQLPPERKAKLRRRRNVAAGIKFILLGIALPFGYHVLSMMTFFSEVSTIENVFVFSGAGLCVAVGVIAIWRSGKD